MNTSALVLMVCTQVLVIATTLIFYVKVLRMPPKPEPDSFADNDDVNR